MGIDIKKRVYLLHHINEHDDGTEDIKLLGVFSSEKKAQETLNSHKTLPGFKDNIRGFSIDEYILDKSEWNEGFGFD